MKSSAATTPATAFDRLDGFRVEFNCEAQRADIVLDRPPYNIITMRQREELAAVFTALDADPQARTIVIRAVGDHFSTGGNIAGFLEMSPDHVSRLADNIASPSRCSKPVIAAVQGYCFGVGFELTLACDFRIAAESAIFALPEMRLGMIPGSGGSARLLHMIGITRTKSMVMRAKRIGAQQGHDWGFITECVPDKELDGAVASLVAELNGFSSLAQRTIKRVLNHGEQLPVEGAIELEGNAYGRLRCSADFKEGVEAFVSKRQPKFVGG